MSADPIQIVEECAQALEGAAALAQEVPALAPYALIVGAAARLVDQLAQAIAAGDAKQMEAVDKALQAALAGLPAELAANDAAVDAKLATEKK